VAAVIIAVNLRGKGTKRTKILSLAQLGFSQGWKKPSFFRKKFLGF